MAAKKHEEEVMNAISQHPMDTAVDPIQVAPHVYYAGNKWVGVFFIDTGDGLILLDLCHCKVQTNLLRTSIKISLLRRYKI